MALDKMSDDMVRETMGTLEQFPELGLIDKPVKISPRRMRTLILFSQQRMNVNINGHIITLIEDSDAPDDFAQAVRDAVPQPEPAAAPVDELTEFRRWKAAQAAQAKGQQP